MNLTDHFALDEMCQTQTGLPNFPDLQARQSIFDLCRLILEPIRARFGPVYVHDGYRSPEVNAAVGGVPTSQHCLGEAADFDCGPLQNLTDVFLWIIANLSFGQVILESKAHADGSVSHWIHVSLQRVNGKNQEALIGTDGKYEPYLPVVGGAL